MTDLENITPEGSAAPVYLDPAPIEPVDSIVLAPAYDAALAAAVNQFITMGLTETSARAVARYDGPLTA